MSATQPKYWIHNIGQEMEVSYPLLNMNILSIGWSDFGKDDTFPMITDETAAFRNLTQPCDGRELMDLGRFLKQMKDGDYVIVPNYPNQDCISVFRICGVAYSLRKLNVPELKDLRGRSVIFNDEHKLKSSEKEFDLGFFRNVIRVGFINKDSANCQLKEAIENCKSVNIELEKRKNADFFRNLEITPEEIIYRKSLLQKYFKDLDKLYNKIKDSMIRVPYDSKAVKLLLNEYGRVLERTVLLYELYWYEYINILYASDCDLLQNDSYITSKKLINELISKLRKIAVNNEKITIGDLRSSIEDSLKEIEGDKKHTLVYENSVDIGKVSRVIEYAEQKPKQVNYDCLTLAEKELISYYFHFLQGYIIYDRNTWNAYKELCMFIGVVDNTELEKINQIEYKECLQKLKDELNLQNISIESFCLNLWLLGMIFKQKVTFNSINVVEEEIQKTIENELNDRQCYDMCSELYQKMNEL
ncbi:MAG: hypothetical protein MJ003_03815 [Paludibacteraceae bacterium]|nr:hypothetical protein [Paludibacteraceae bacterium]